MAHNVRTPEELWMIHLRETVRKLKCPHQEEEEETGKDSDGDCYASRCPLRDIGPGCGQEWLAWLVGLDDEHPQ